MTNKENLSVIVDDSKNLSQWVGKKTHIVFAEVQQSAPNFVWTAGEMLVKLSKKNNGFCTAQVRFALKEIIAAGFVCKTTEIKCTHTREWSTGYTRSKNA